MLSRRPEKKKINLVKMTRNNCWLIKKDGDEKEPAWEKSRTKRKREMERGVKRKDNTSRSTLYGVGRYLQTSRSGNRRQHNSYISIEFELTGKRGSRNAGKNGSWSASVHIQTERPFDRWQDSWRAVYFASYLIMTDNVGCIIA
jgi:hypothetical protein